MNGRVITDVKVRLVNFTFLEHKDIISGDSMTCSENEKIIVYSSVFLL